MTDTEEKTEFKFSELSDSAKETARARYREGHQDYDWWERIYDDAVTVGGLMGIRIGDFTYSYKSTTSKEQVKRTKPDIWFSGFSSQGDGCCYSGHLHIADMEGAVAKVKEHTDTDETLLSIAADAERIVTSIKAWLLTCKLKDEEPEWENPFNDSIAIKGEERGYSTRIDSDYVFHDVRDDLNSFVSDFADWIYSQLEAEDEYMNSDEYIDAGIEANGHLFDEFGSLI